MYIKLVFYIHPTIHHVLPSKANPVMACITDFFDSRNPHTKFSNGCFNNIHKF